ncbi:MAG: hypothetical protein NVS3B12_27210 [Acidimicrobiales bacterium]
MYETARRMRPTSLIVAVAAGVVIGGLLLAVAIWILGMIAGVVFALIRLATLVALAAGVVYGAKYLMRRSH